MTSHILWDLDGTLTDPRLGMIRCVQYALTISELPVPPEDELLRFIGPPLHHSFRQLVPNCSENEAWELVEKYRVRYSKIGIFENSVFNGVSTLLEKLNRKSHYIATSKPHVFASQIINHFSLEKYFVKVYGSELSGVRSDKGDLIEFILSSESIDPENAIMIGDRKHDVLGAKKAGIRSIGITWGYGSREELAEAGANHILDDPISLGEYLDAEP